MGRGLNYDLGREMTARFSLQQFTLDANIATVAIDETILNVNVGFIYSF